MAIGRKPVKRTTDIPEASEKDALAFIDKAGKAPDTLPEEPQESRASRPVQLRFRAPLLKRVDAAAQRRSIGRTAWIMYVISRALEEEGL